MTKLKWKTFVSGEEVYVFFPRRKPGTSSKFTSYWQGPYRVIKKMSDITYLINCGPKGGEQVTHVDRMRKKYPQVRSNEELPPLEEDQEPLDEKGKDDVAYDSPVRNNRPVRDRRPPKWLHDYYVDKPDK